MFESQVFHVEDYNFAGFDFPVIRDCRNEANITAHEESFHAIIEYDVSRVVVEQLIDADFVIFLSVFKQRNHVAGNSEM